MPTTAKLIGAVFFAMLGLGVAQQMLNHWPEGMAIGYLREGAALAGLLAGWRIAGTDVGQRVRHGSSQVEYQGYLDSFGTGMRAGFVAAAGGIFVFAVIAVLLQSTHGRYHGLEDLLNALVSHALKYGALFMHGDVAGMLLLGAGLGGMVSEAAHRRWG